MKKKYAEAAVAFIDVLGFKKMVAESKESAKSFQHLLNVLEVFKQRKKENKKVDREEGNVVSIFSDSIVISYEVDKSNNALLELVLDVLYLQNELLAHEVLCRGGIALGSLVHTKNMVFGPAMVEAYRLESSEAVYPRVVMTKATRDEGIKLGSYSSNKSDLQEYFDDLLLADKNDPELMYIDYLHQLTEVDVSEDYYNQQVNGIIAKGLNDPYVAKKYHWLKQYFGDGMCQNRKRMLY